MRSSQPALEWYRVLVLCGVMGVGTGVGATGSAQAVDGDLLDSGRGWTVTRIDVDVELMPQSRVFTTKGIATLELTGLDRSNGPTLLLSTHRTADGEPAIAFDRVESPGATTRVLPEPFADRWQQATVRFNEPLPRGSPVEVRFGCRSVAAVRRMIVDPSAAMADWLSGWLPFALSQAKGEITLGPALFRAPGRTTLHLPPGWRGLVDGDRIDHRESPGGTIEIWSTPEGIARGFVAGPYQVFEKTVGERQIRIYQLDSAATLAPEPLAERMGQAIAAEEDRLGPLPFPGAYSLVEFPRLPEQSFGAVGEQTHIILQPPNLDYAAENIQTVAHEVAHAWWGNLIGTAGPGAKWCSESLAELGALIAVERLDGMPALERFLDFGRTGTDPYYCASGYFATLRQGHDMPIATMGGGSGTHALANSKGVWIFHMLRAELGDETFFGVLRDVIRDFAGRDVTAEALRERFVRAAPEHDLERFFAQWLDRTGAPVLDVTWFANAGGTGAILDVAQVQEGDPFTFPLEVEIDLADGSSVLHTLAVDSARKAYEIPTAARPVDLHLDPERKVLIWRPEYGPPPGRDLDVESARVSDDLARAVVGSYRFTGMEKGVEVFQRNGAIYMQPEGSVPYRLLHERDGLFRVDAPGGMMAEFDLSATPCPSLVSIEGGGRERYEARRVERRERPAFEGDGRP